MLLKSHAEKNELSSWLKFTLFLPNCI